MQQVNVQRVVRAAHTIRRSVVSMVGKNGQGYVQQGLGAADLFAALYFAELRLDEYDAEWADRDRCILSTAHNSAVFYATLAERGLINKSHLENYCKDGSPSEINVSERMGPIVECTCGSLGQGLSVAVGMAMSARRHQLRARIYIVLGDGEMQEGQVWEAAMCAATYGLDNLCLIVDMNNMQVEGHVDQVQIMAPVDQKWRAFGWSVASIDGNDITAILNAFDAAKRSPGKPSVILAKTLVGKGVSFLEGKLSHNMVFPREVAALALNELGFLE